MPGKITVEGVGVVEVDDAFFSAPAEVQQATLAEIKASVAPPRKKGSAPAPAPQPGPRPGQESEDAIAPPVGPLGEITITDDGDPDPLQDDAIDQYVNAEELAYKLNPQPGPQVNQDASPAGEAPPQPAPGSAMDFNLAPYGRLAWEGIKRGLTDTAGLGAKVAANVMGWGNLGGDNVIPQAVEGLSAKLGITDPDVQPENAAERYTLEGSRFLGGALVPEAGLAARGITLARRGATEGLGYLDRLAMGTVKHPIATAAANVTGSAGAVGGGDVAESVGLPKGLGQVVGGIAGGALPMARQGLGAVADARFVNRQARDNPYASFDAEIAQELDGLVNSTARAPTDPKGRAALTIKTINSLESRYLGGFRSRIRALDIPKAEKQRLIDAIEARHSILQPELDALRETVEGTAVADAVTKIQRLRALTPEVKRAGVGNALRNVADMIGTAGGAALGGPVAAPAGLGMVRYLLRRGTDAEAARVHSAERVLARKSAYDKLAARVGPSGQRESRNAFDELYDSTVTGQEVERGAQREAVAAERASRPTREDRQRFRSELDAASTELDPRDLLNLPKTDRQLAARISAREKAIAKMEARAASFDLDVPGPAAKPAKRNAQDQVIDAQIAQGVKGESMTQQAFADRVGVPVEDLVRALDQLGPEFEPLADDIQRIRFNYPTKNRIAPTLVPALKRILTEDGTMARAQEAATAQVATATARRTKAANTVAQRSQPLADAIAEAPPAPVASEPPVAPGPEPRPESNTGRTWRGIDRPAQWAQGRDRALRAQDESARAMWADARLSDEAMAELSGADTYVIQHTRTTKEATDWFEEAVVPEMLAKGVPQREIDLARSHIYGIASHKRYRTPEEFEAGTQARHRGRPRKAAQD